jgi:hypothetical protein
MSNNNHLIVQLDPFIFFWNNQLSFSIDTYYAAGFGWRQITCCADMFFNEPPVISNQEAAKIMNVSPAIVKRAKKLLSYKVRLRHWVSHITSVALLIK